MLIALNVNFVLSKTYVWVLFFEAAAEVNVLWSVQDFVFLTA